MIQLREKPSAHRKGIWFRDYDQVGREAQARRELERIYAEYPAFEDVRKRLGLGS